MKKLDIKFRDPNEIMKLSRLGSFHQSKFSFLRSFIREFKDWDYKRNFFDLDENGYGTAVYSFSKNQRNYSLVCFAQHINSRRKIGQSYSNKMGCCFCFTRWDSN